LAESFELSDQVSDVSFGVAAGEVVGAEVVIELTGGKHVPAGDDDRVLDGADGAAVTAAGAEALVLGGEVGAAARAGGGERGFL